jgi:hypothetical protein
MPGEMEVGQAMALADGIGESRGVAERRSRRDVHEEAAGLGSGSLLGSSHLLSSTCSLPPALFHLPPAICPRIPCYPVTRQVTESPSHPATSHRARPPRSVFSLQTPPAPIQLHSALCTLHSALCLHSASLPPCLPDPSHAALCQTATVPLCLCALCNLAFRLSACPSASASLHSASPHSARCALETAAPRYDLPLCHHTILSLRSPLHHSSR